MRIIFLCLFIVVHGRNSPKPPPRQSAFNFNQFPLFKDSIKKFSDAFLNSFDQEAKITEANSFVQNKPVNASFIKLQFRSRESYLQIKRELSINVEKTQWTTFNIEENGNMRRLVDFPLVIFAPGFLTKLSSYTSWEQAAFSSAFSQRNDVNFMTLDTGDYLSTWPAKYHYSAAYAVKIGTLLGETLKNITDNHALTKLQIHLIGHSLGAQLCGAAARRYYELTGRKIARISALDPAKPCFSAGGLPSVSKGDAEWVDVLHTNPDKFGQKNAIGDVDFYPNALEFNTYCKSKNSAYIWGNVCSHGMAVLYYSSTVPPDGATYSMFQCDSVENLSNCQYFHEMNKTSEKVVQMGYPASKSNFPDSEGKIYYLPKIYTNKPRKGKSIMDFNVTLNWD